MIVMMSGIAVNLYSSAVMPVVLVIDIFLPLYLNSPVSY